MQHKGSKFVFGDISTSKPLRPPNKEATGAKGGIAFSTHWICYICCECPRTIHNSKRAGGGKKRKMRGDEWGRENRRVNNSVCLRFSAVSRLRVAPQIAMASANLVSVQSQGPVTVCPHTHKYTHARMHRESYCHGNQTPLWLFPSQENNRHQSFSTSLFHCRCLSSFSISGRYKLTPLFIHSSSSFPLLHVQEQTLMSSCPPPLLSSLHVPDSHEFDSLRASTLDLYSSHKWEAKRCLNPTETNTLLNVFKLQPKQHGERRSVCHFKEAGDRNT